MPPASNPEPESAIVAPRAFVAEVHAFASAWLHDFADYAEDTFGDASEQAEREQELEHIRQLGETSETLLQAAPPATLEQFRQWVQELSRLSNRPTAIETDPENPNEPGAVRLHATLNTALFSYSIAAVWATDENGDRHSYLGAICARHGNGGRDLADGPATAATWRRILRDIVAMEMTAYQTPDTDPDLRLAEARDHRSFPADIRTAYEPNGDIIVQLAGDTARNIAQQAQAARLTTAEYLQAKLRQPAMTAETNSSDEPAETRFYRLTLSPVQFRQAQAALGAVGIPLDYANEFELGSETESYASLGGVAGIILPRLEEQLPDGKTLVSDIPIPELRNLMRHYANDPAWFGNLETDVDDFIKVFPHLVVDADEG